MTSCPREEDLVLLAEGDLDETASASVVDHLVACAACRELLGRSEAALRYALGGIEDAAAASVAPNGTTPASAPAVPATSAPSPRAAAVAPRRPRRPVPAALAAVALAAVAVAAGVAVRRADEGVAVPPRPAPTAVEARIDHLLRVAESLAAPRAADDGGAEEVATAALAAADARAALGLPTADARLADVAERFAGTSAGREARARLALAGGGR